MESAPAGRDIVVIGGSAGALEPLKAIVAALGPDLPVATSVVLHLGRDQPSMLAPILNRVAGPHAVMPRTGDPVLPGYLYVPTPDRHMELTPHGFRLGRGPRVNGSRPAIDVLFRSAAETFGNRVVGVVLSGGLDDGSAGLVAIREAGGLGIVQDPADALMESMPSNAIRRARPEHVAPAADIGDLIAAAIGRRPGPAAKHIEGGDRMEEAIGADDVDGRVTGLTCPECHGSIWLREVAGATTLECRIGHSYAPEVFAELQAENVENALWAGVRALEEQVALADVMARRAQRYNDEGVRDRYRVRRRIASANAESLRRLLTEGRD